MADFNFKFFPWERGEKPYFTNPEGFEWYVDKDCLHWAKRKSLKAPVLDAIPFLVKKGDQVDRLLIGSNQQILYKADDLESMCWHIDFLRMVAAGEKQDNG